MTTLDRPDTILWDDDLELAAEYDEMCECELDWSCPMHAHLPTPEDRIATDWSTSNP